MIYALGVMATTFTGTVLFCWLRRYLRFLSPLTWFLAVYAVIFVVRPVVMVVTGDYGLLDEYRTLVGEEVIARAGAISAGGLLCFVIGYALAMSGHPGRRIRLPKITWSPVLTVLAALPFMALALFTLYHLQLLPFISRVRPSFHTGVVPTQLVASGTTAYIVLSPFFLTGVLLLWSSRFGTKWWVLLMGATIWFLTLYGGWHRWTLVLSLLGLAAVENAREGRKRLLVAIAVVAPVGLLLFSAIGRSRGLVPALLAREVTLSETFAGEGGSTNWSADFGMFEGYVWATCVYPRYAHYEYGQDIYQLWVLAPIPRVLWPGKPAVRHAQLDVLSSGLAWGRLSSTSAIGTFYMDGGPVGVALGMAGLGWFLGFCYDIFRRHRTKTYVLYLYCTGLALSPIAFRSGIAPLPAYLFFWMSPGILLCFVAVLYRTLVREQRRARAGAPIRPEPSL